MKIKSIDQLPSVKNYLQRIGAEVRSLRAAAVQERVGKYFRDVAKISFSVEGIVKAKKEYLPTEDEQKAIVEEFRKTEFPQLKKIPQLINLPDEIKETPKQNIFEFRDLDNQIIMLQVRVDNKKTGEKYYLPYTYWDDDEWRRMEPDGLLPLYNLNKIKDNTTVFIHEGAKAARNVQEMIEAETTEMKEKLKNHPWSEELQGTVHLGWIGGALSPHRTDWSILAKIGVKRAYIISDNDKEGIEAVQKISERLRLLTFHVQFTNEFPAAFDLGDEFPKGLFKEMEGKQMYRGPWFRQCIHPATWATDKYKPEKGKEIITLRDHFKDMWAYVEEADIYVCKQLPNIVRPEKILNNMLAPFSHTLETSKLILKAYNGRQTKLCYRPDRPSGLITQNETSAINLYTPTYVKNEEGDVSPFLEFLDYMFPIEEERKEVERWCATLAGRPDIRMEYGILLVSEATGVGKTTLGSKILANLVGWHNTGNPREVDIVDNHFNDWVAHKRFVTTNEIYSGHSWKAYHALKSIITDKEISVNQKYQRPYIIENWCHVMACSNSRQALKMEEDDRRWFYPEVTGERWSKEKFGWFIDWLEAGGLGIIKTWAERYDNYVMPGERAPMTERKKEMIEGSRSEAQNEAASIAEMMVNSDKPMAMAMKEIIFAIRNSVQGKVFDSDLEIRKTMKEVGAKVLEKRIRISGQMQYILVNERLENEVKKHPENTEEIVRQYMVKPSEVFQSNM